MWQDALLSFSYDCPHGAVMMCCGPLCRNLEFPLWISCTYAFLRVVIDFSLHNNLHGDVAPVSETIQHFKECLETIRRDATVSQRSVLDQLEHLTIRIHTGYMISQICRFVLRRPDNLDEAGTQKQQYTTACLENSADVIQVFIEMHSLSPAIVRSWAFLHNALSCALLLGSPRML